MCSVLDVSKQRRYEKKLNQESMNTQIALDIVNMANELSGFNDFLKVLIDKVCHTLGWDIGHVYKIDDNDESTMCSLGLWYLKYPDRCVSFMQLTKDIHF